MHSTQAWFQRGDTNAASRFAKELLGQSAYGSPVSASQDRSLGNVASREIGYRVWLEAVAPGRSRASFQPGDIAAVAPALPYGEKLPAVGDWAASLLESNWDPAKHPRRGGPPNAGWFAGNGGGATGGTRPPKPALTKSLVARNRELSNLAGQRSTATIRAANLAGEIESAPQMASDVAGAFAAGLTTGGKALINGGATAIKNTATLGLSSSQLELIGVTDEDRRRGYDTAVTIATASGEVFIAVGSAGAATALSKGGSVARGASGALVVYDTAGNAVGVVQGSYDAATDGINIRNGGQIAANAIGLAATIKPAAKSIGDNLPNSKARRVPTPEEVEAYIEKLPRKNTPTGKESGRYEVKHTGPHNYEVTAGGVSLDIDGYRGTTILEAKHVGSPSISPYVPGSSCPDFLRIEVEVKLRDELTRMRQIIQSQETPFLDVEIITNTPQSKVYFERLLKECGLKGTVRVVS